MKMQLKHSTNVASTSNLNDDYCGDMGGPYSSKDKIV